MENLSSFTSLLSTLCWQVILRMEQSATRQVHHTQKLTHCVCVCVCVCVRTRMYIYIGQSRLTENLFEVGTSRRMFLILPKTQKSTMFLSLILPLIWSQTLPIFLISAPCLFVLCSSCCPLNSLSSKNVTPRQGAELGVPTAAVWRRSIIQPFCSQSTHTHTHGSYILYIHTKG